MLVTLAASLEAQFRVYPEYAPGEFNRLLYRIPESPPGTRLPLALAVSEGLRPSPTVVQDFSTSALAPEGAPPAESIDTTTLERRRSGDPAQDLDLYRRQNAFARWSMMYAAGSATDGLLETAWSEGVAGNGTGEILLVPFPAGSRLEIHGGFARREDLFERNGRPRGVGLTILAPVSRIETVGEVVYQDLVVLARGTALLEDLNAFQPLPLPEYGPALARYASGSRRGRTLFLAIEILSVYQGSRWADTMISEVRFTR